MNLGEKLIEVMAGPPLRWLPLFCIPKMTHFRHERKGGLWATGRGMRCFPRDTYSRRGSRGLREWDRPEEPSEWPGRRAGSGRGGRPTLSRRTPRWAWVCAATAHDSGLHRLAVQAETTRLY